MEPNNDPRQPTLIRCFRCAYGWWFKGPSQKYAMCPLCHYLNRLPTNPTRYRGPQPKRWTNRLIPKALTMEAQK